MEDTIRGPSWRVRLGIAAAVLVALAITSTFLISRADGPVFVFAGGPLVSGELVDLADLDWPTLDAATELEMELVGTARSLTLWFSVTDGVAYVACDLDCVGGRLNRWPQQVALDDRVVIRIDDRRAEARLTHVPHETAEYATVRADRLRKYSGEGGGRAAAETAAHDAVVDVGEALTGRASKEEPGDRLFRVDPR